MKRLASNARTSLRLVSSLLLLLLLLPLPLAAFGCSTAEVTDASESNLGTAGALERLAEARAKLERALAAAGDAYLYEVTSLRPTGSGTRTMLVFQNGAPVQRGFWTLAPDPETGKPTVTDWNAELGPNVGEAPGFAPATPIRALYDRCRDEVLAQPPETSPRLELDANGMLARCTYTAPGCTDDCSRGVSVSFFQPFDLAGPIAATRAKVASANGDYTYSVNGSSFESGAWWSTKLVFRANAPSSRAYVLRRDGEPDVTWSESGADIGSHEDGAPAHSLETLATRCRDEVLGKNLAESWLTFELDPDGLVSTCTIFPEVCADDCTEGVTVSDLTFGR